MRDLLLATHNKHKVEEIRQFLQGLDFKILCLDDIPGGLPPVVEDGMTFLFNAQKKARAAAQATGLLCMADDSGLEVEALEGAPGVFSARYAGENCNDLDNNKKLLAELAKLGRIERKAVFRTVLVISEPAGASGKIREEWVEGRCEGLIQEQMTGTQGFGYDPLFYLPSLKKTYAQLSLEEKNKVSHRGKALARARTVLNRW